MNETYRYLPNDGLLVDHRKSPPTYTNMSSISDVVLITALPPISIGTAYLSYRAVQNSAIPRQEASWADTTTRTINDYLRSSDPSTKMLGYLQLAKNAGHPIPNLRELEAATSERMFSSTLAETRTELSAYSGKKNADADIAIAGAFLGGFLAATMVSMCTRACTRMIRRRRTTPIPKTTDASVLKE